jgi:hypothetical protein
MKKKWECSHVQICSTAVSAEEYNLLVDEWAKTVYSHFCQLTLNQNSVPVTSNQESAGA